MRPTTRLTLFNITTRLTLFNIIKRLLGAIEFECAIYFSQAVLTCKFPNSSEVVQNSIEFDLISIGVMSQFDLS